MSQVRIVVFENKYGPNYYSIPTDEDLKKAAVLQVQERHSLNYFPEPRKPEDIDITEEIIDTLPESMKYSARYKLNAYNANMSEYESMLEDYKLVQRALDGDGDAALSIINNRSDYEYEGYEIIEPTVV
jgi:hypothetical protein